MFRKFAASLIIVSSANLVPLAFAEDKTEPAKDNDPAAAAPCTAGGDQSAIVTGKRMWADSYLYADAPKLEVEKWLTKEPDLEGKFIIIEFWRTWCGACKRMTPLMNTLQEKYGKELVVIGITGESEEAIKNYNGPKKTYFLALDKAVPAPEKPAPAEEAETPEAKSDQEPNADATKPGQGQYEAKLGVWGWPHVIILEPEHHAVVWEGFPGLKGFELTEAKVEKILAIGRKTKQEAAAPKK